MSPLRVEYFYSQTLDHFSKIMFYNKVKLSIIDMMKYEIIIIMFDASFVKTFRSVKYNIFAIMTTPVSPE